jgi:hypothetical protein
MKSLITILCLSLLSYVSAFADSGTGPLLVQPPAGWSVELKGDKAPVYVVKGPQNEPLMLMFSRWPLPVKQEEISNRVDTKAAKFLEEGQKHSVKFDQNSYTKGEIKGDLISGEFAMFKIFGGQDQVLFMFTDGTNVWNGQYTGSADRWNDALETLKAIKKSNP